MEANKIFGRRRKPVVGSDALYTGAACHVNCYEATPTSGRFVRRRLSHRARLSVIGYVSKGVLLVRSTHGVFALSARDLRPL